MFDPARLRDFAPAESIVIRQESVDSGTNGRGYL